jgi:hypothetical protein
MSLIKKIGKSLLLVIVMVSFGVFAGDMVLTLDDGRDVILHDDNTWGFAKFTVSEDEEDYYITIDDGRTICLKTDNTWEFTKGRPQNKRSFNELPTVSVSSSVKKPTLDAAVKAASEDAVKKAALKLSPYAKKHKLTNKYLVACIKNEIGENGIESTYKPGWIALAKINITKVQTKNILECVETQLESAPADEPSGESKAK